MSYLVCLSLAHSHEVILSTSGVLSVGGWSVCSSLCLSCLFVRPSRDDFVDERLSVRLGGLSFGLSHLFVRLFSHVVILSMRGVLSVGGWSVC